ncbi:3-deoxy-D-manno-octulosonic acid transferase [Candidatus Neomarinimicrobiota bacterium]
MKYFWFLIYNLFLYPLIFIFACIGAIFNKKMREGLMGRFQTINILKNASKNWDNKQSVYWFHAASHGEFEQVRPVLKGLKEIDKKCYVIASFFSPSGYKNVDDKNIDCKIYLPFDFIWSIRRTLKIIKPKKIIFASYDIWPNVIWLANKRKIHTTVFALRFKQNTSKILPIVKQFYRTVYKSFSTIYTITEEDNYRLNKILKSNNKPIIRVLGNPRYDQVKEKADKFTKDRTITVMMRDKRLIVGSVWPEDEKKIINSIFQLLAEDEELCVLWVPHEPSEKYIQSSFQKFESHGLNPTIIRSKKTKNIQNGRVVILGVVGALSKFYWQGQIAYIGGGFSGGIHNVMEPAIARLPVIFGQKYRNSHEAMELVKTGGGFSINNGIEFYDIMKILLNDKNRFLDASFAATKVIHDNVGSATRVVRSIIRD